MIGAALRCALLVLAGSVLPAACSDGPRVVETGVVVEVTSDFETPALDAVQLTGSGAEAVPVYNQTFSLISVPLSPGGYSLPLRVALDPPGDPAAPFRVKAIGQINGAAVVEDSATLHFAVGRVVFVELPLQMICQGSSCPAASTCAGTGSADCVPDTVDPGKLPTYQPTD